MKTIYLQDENYNWIKFQFDKIKDIQNELTSRNIQINSDCEVSDAYIGNDSRVLNGSTVDGSTVNGSTVNGSRVLNGSTVDGSTVNGSTIDGSTVLNGSRVDGSRVLNGEITKYTAIFCANAYLYSMCAYLNKKGEQVIQLGCYTRFRSEWDADFWNNPSEFPNNGSEKSEARLRAFKVACFFLDQLPK